MFSWLHYLLWYIELLVVFYYSLETNKYNRTGGHHLLPIKTYGWNASFFAPAPGDFEGFDQADQETLEDNQPNIMTSMLPHNPWSDWWLAKSEFSMELHGGGKPGKPPGLHH